ncbi:hypothetical protein DL771_008604 [Monosporascus sp. 5C6A]|nr:hypothetical protein DL771_008604 [Monosporascus sp. 5C6A]
MASKRKNRGKLPVKSDPSDNSFVLQKGQKHARSPSPFPSPQPEPSDNQDVPQGKEFFSKGEEEIKEEAPVPQPQQPEERFRTPIQRQLPEANLNKLYTSLGTKISGIRQDVRARENSYQQVQEEVRELKQQNEKLKLQSQKTTETIKRLNEMVTQFLDKLDPKPKSPSTNAQPKKSESAKFKIKASGFKEIPIAVENKLKQQLPQHP